MNKILFNLILGITIITHMWTFPVHAEEGFALDAQIVVENLNNEENSEDPGEETFIDNAIETASENETIDEGVSSEETEEESGTDDALEEVSTDEGVSEEAADGEGEEIEEDQPEDPTAGMTGMTPGVPENPTAGVTEMSSDDLEDPTAGETEMSPDGFEDPTAGVTEMSPDGFEDPTAGETEVPPDDPADYPDPQIPDADPEVDEKPENADTAPAAMHDRPVINSISTDGTSVTLEWDNPEGELFQIYRWNIFPYVVGTSTTGSFVDKDVTYGRSYTYYIATTSSAYRYPYSQTISVRVRPPIEDIDGWHKIGDDLAWGPAKEGKSLVISGNGSMPDFSSPSETPWHDSAGEIKHISIDEGVTYVGDYTFSDMKDLEDVSLPSSVREYGHEVFRGSTNLEFFKHDSAVDGDQLHIAVQYLMGVYSGDTFEPEVKVRKGSDGKGFDGMPELILGRDYTVTYNNTTEVGDGTIEITFIGNYADAGSVVIPFIVVSELRKDEKIKTVTEIELLPSSSTYTGTAQHPDMIVRSGRWILKEGVDYILTYTDMVNVGTYTVTAQGIGVYSGKVQAVYTILKQKQSKDPKPPVKPSVPDKRNPSDKDDITETDDTSSKETVKERTKSNEKKTEIEEKGTDVTAEPERDEEAEAVAEPERAEEPKVVTEPEKKQAKPPSIFDSGSGGGLSGKGDNLLGTILENQGSTSVKFFVGAVGIVLLICTGVYFWAFYRFLHWK